MNYCIISTFIIIICIFVLIYMYRNVQDNFKNNWFEKIDGIVYINLEKREDRKKLILDELAKLETDMNRVNKVSGVYIPKNGHKGCIQSHIIALKMAKMNRWDSIMIFEDDMELKVSPEVFNNSINGILDYFKSNDTKWDIIMLATCNSKKDPVEGTDFVKVKQATTSSAYIVNSKYYDTILDLFIHCNNNMSRDKWGKNGDWEPYALDQQWNELIKNDNWYGFKNDLIKQRAISSTINGEKE